MKAMICDRCGAVEKGERVDKIKAVSVSVGGFQPKYYDLCQSCIDSLWSDLTPIPVQREAEPVGMDYPKRKKICRPSMASEVTVSGSIGDTAYQVNPYAEPNNE